MMYLVFPIRLHLSLENLGLFRLQNPHVNSQKGEQLEALLYREKQDIERLQDMARRAQLQPTVTGFLSRARTFPRFCIYLLL